MPGDRAASRCMAFIPYPISAQDLERMHGNDERVPIASLESGLKMITNTLLEVAGK